MARWGGTSSGAWSIAWAAPSRASAITAPCTPRAGDGELDELRLAPGQAGVDIAGPVDDAGQPAGLLLEAGPEPAHRYGPAVSPASPSRIRR